MSRSACSARRYQRHSEGQRAGRVQDIRTATICRWSASVFSWALAPPTDGDIYPHGAAGRPFRQQNRRVNGEQNVGGARRETLFLSVFPAVGRIAQLVEQLTLNQRVQGSSPCAPTKIAAPEKSLPAVRRLQAGAGASIGRCARADRCRQQAADLRRRDVVVGVERRRLHDESIGQEGVDLAAFRLERAPFIVVFGGARL
jgi:hypothetical protein